MADDLDDRIHCRDVADDVDDLMRRAVVRGNVSNPDHLNPVMFDVVNGYASVYDCHSYAVNLSIHWYR